MAQTNFVFVCFGKDQSYYTQATYAICSLLAFAAPPFTVHVMTDYPERFAHLNNHINLIELNKNQMTEWRGPHGNSFRIKLSALILAAEKIDEKFIFLDTDVILLKPLDPFIEAVKPETFGMHTAEFTLAEKINYHRWRHRLASLLNFDLSRKQGYMCRAVADRTWQGIYVPKTQVMWNSGVFAVDKADFDCIDLSLRILDEINANNIKFFTAEQLAISIACSHKGTIIAAKDYFIHYWKEKETMTQWISEKLKLESPGSFNPEAIAGEMRLNQDFSAALNSSPEKTELTPA